MVFNDCSGSSGDFGAYILTWQLLSESAGGPAIAHGSTVDLILFSGGLNPSNAQRSVVSVQVEFSR